MAVEPRRAPRVLDLGRTSEVALEIDAAEAADVLMSVWAVCDEKEYDTLDVGRARLEELRAGAPPDLLAALDELVGGEAKIPAHLLGLVWETPRPRTMAAFLDVLERMDALDVLIELLGSAGKYPLPAETARSAAGGDPAAKEALIGSLAEWPRASATVANLLELGATEVKSRLLAILPRWYEQVYLPSSPDAGSVLDRDAEAKRELARTRSVAEVVERATNGYQYDPGPEISRIALFPGYWQRPWVLLAEHDRVKIFCYPLELDHGPGGPPAAELARLYKALGDEGRLRLLRRVSRGPMTLSEAAQELDVAKSTAHHHLAMLRHAGLVVLREEGDEKVYNLRRDLLPQAGALLETFLASPPGPRERSRRGRRPPRPRRGGRPSV